MLRGILIAVLSLGVVGTAVWGYQEHREKNAILLNSENNYQRAFHDLAYQVDLLHDKIGTTLAMNSRKSLSPGLAEVWRLTSEAHSNVGQLPLTLLPFNKTEEFLAKIGTFSYKTAIRDLDKKPLTDEEYGTLKKLYSQSKDIQDELRNVQHLVLKNNLRWMDVELALATGKEASDNTIIDGFKTVEKTAKGYDEANMNNPSFVSYNKKDTEYRHVQGSIISKGEAQKIAKTYSGKKDSKVVKVTQSKKGAHFGFYSVTLKAPGEQVEAMDITKKGGYPIWYINNRNIGKQKLSLNDGEKKAAGFLRNHGFNGMELFESTQFDTVGVYSFVTVQKGIRIYPETIKMKIALDNGQVVGFTTEDYLQSHHMRNIPKPAISLADARGYVNPKLKVMEDRLAVIVNDLNEEVLCYEFLGTLGNDTYRIYINADNGIEEKVEKLKNAEPLYRNAL
ncbi:germination protein YpeB [Bacillus sp. FJAT-49736]|uniref:germination protein YpeB n=1 Tax=Bacillus sp. FJAT-49736 TaxID=2833582 RepID=UPI001BC9C4FB|nr:germination protein YpeB [Bacillus sp. FJAT-49736]MBS4173296.1 germination protein YpeB [Bacillus sp. FJAT-49736]